MGLFSISGFTCPISLFSSVKLTQICKNLDKITVMVALELKKDDSLGVLFLSVSDTTGSKLSAVDYFNFLYTNNNVVL